jgi:Uma2 family endonuclease
MTTKTRLSVEAFLCLPETEPYSELIGGAVVQKPMPSLSHSTLTSELIRLLGNYLVGSGEGRVVNELRHADRADEWVFLPDISVTMHGRWPAPPAEMHGPVEVMPDFAIEVLSPDDQPGRVAQKIAHYMQSGVRLLWVIDPQSESVTIWRRDRDPMVASGGTLNADPVLATFSLDLDALFATLHR